MAADGEVDAPAHPLPPQAPLRAGSVPYFNAAPLVRGLEGRVRLLPPSALALALHRGEIDAALLSITEALLRPGYDLLDGPCIASDGAVFSVVLAHRKPIEQAHTIHCHAASLTSVNLLRVLLAERGWHPQLKALSDPARAADEDFVLLIGDPAIAFRRCNVTHAILDLGTAWLELTGLPFVYAAWVLRRDADTTQLRSELRLAAERGQRDLEVIIRTTPDFDESFRREYLTRHTRHHLGPREKAGIIRFVELLRRHIRKPVHEPHFVI
jgi:predicted solute-binding protein